MERSSTVKSLSNSNQSKDLELPKFSNSLDSVLRNGELLRVDGTNVVRVPFGIRQPVRQRPAKQSNWATLVIPLHPSGSPTPPPQAA